MTTTDPTVPDACAPAPTIPEDALGFTPPAECASGFAFNVRLLERHWAVLRQAASLIAAREPAA